MRSYQLARESGSIHVACSSRYSCNLSNAFMGMQKLNAALLKTSLLCAMVPTGVHQRFAPVGRQRRVMFQRGGDSRILGTIDLQSVQFVSNLVEHEPDAVIIQKNSRSGFHALFHRRGCHQRDASYDVEITFARERLQILLLNGYSYHIVIV